MDAFFNEVNSVVTGEVTLKLYKGNIIPAGIKSPYSLYDMGLGGFTDVDMYDQKDATVRPEGRNGLHPLLRPPAQDARPVARQQDERGLRQAGRAPEKVIGKVILERPLVATGSKKILGFTFVNRGFFLLNFKHVSCAPQDLLDVVVDKPVGGYTNLCVESV